MNLQQVNSWLRKNETTELIITEEYCTYCNFIQELLSRERIIIREDKGIMIPNVSIHIVKGNEIRGISTKIEEKYHIFIYEGIFVAYKEYLTNLNYEFLEEVESSKEEYIEEFLLYGRMFLALHEYAHIYCGHTDAKLEDNENKRAQECEADKVAFDYLIQWVLNNYDTEICTEHLVRLFVSVYFVLKIMNRNRHEIYYDNKKIDNYYDPELVAKREYPLSAQRILYLFDMLTIGIMTDKIQLLPIKDDVIIRLKDMHKNIASKIGEHGISNNLLALVQASIDGLNHDVENLKEIIPRYKEK